MNCERNKNKLQEYLNALAIFPEDPLSVHLCLNDPYWKYYLAYGREHPYLTHTISKEEFLRIMHTAEICAVVAVFENISEKHLESLSNRYKQELIVTRRPYSKTQIVLQSDG
jgi:hypothetical protein